MSGRVALYSTLTGRRPLADLELRVPQIIGRSSQADIVLCHPSVSRQHCEIELFAPRRVRVRDLNSSNGTWCGGVRVEETVIRIGTSFRVGEVELVALSDGRGGRNCRLDSTATTWRLTAHRAIGSAADGVGQSQIRDTDLIEYLAQLTYELELDCAAVVLGGAGHRGDPSVVVAFPDPNWRPGEQALGILRAVTDSRSGLARGRIVLPTGEERSVTVVKRPRSAILLYIERRGRRAMSQAVTNRLRAVANRIDKLLASTRLFRQGAEDPLAKLIGGAALDPVRQFIRLAAQSLCPVLITGETGTGKELVAQAIHELSPRSANPFVSVNCGALSESLLESELFGHEKGAFTGAIATHRGVFERSRAGTLFLDEIAEMSPAAQCRLLRVLETGTFTRVGGEELLHTDARILAATNRNLVAQVRRQRFREDLFFRLSVLTVELPPLRERGDDIALLARRFAQEIGQRYGKPDLTFSAAAMAKLLAYHWPGNVRELRAMIEAAVLRCRGATIEAADLRLLGKTMGRAVPLSLLSHEELQRHQIETTLAATGGNKSEAARRLRITRAKLYSLLDRFGLR